MRFNGLGSLGAAVCVMERVEVSENSIDAASGSVAILNSEIQHPIQEQITSDRSDVPR